MKLSTLLINEKASMKEAMIRMNNDCLDTIFVVDEVNTLKGVITDGDIRRALIRGVDLDENVSEVMKKEIISITDNKYAENKDEAISMLLELSGQSHEVISCVSLGILDDSESDTVNFNMNIVETKVFMKTLTAYECSKYWDTREPLDKAGSYGIQGIGATFIEKIVGSHSNVVGLPIFETCKILDDLKINYWLSK